MENKPIPLGNIQILTDSNWKDFTWLESFNYIDKFGIFPEARAWNGQDWIKTGIRDHIISILNVIQDFKE